MSLEVDVRANREAFELDAAFEVERGGTVALLGPNGSGKTTMVSILAGLLAPREGIVRLGDRVLDDVAHGVHVEPEERPVGIVFQGRFLFPHLDAIENVAFPLRARGMATNEARERARELLENLDVGGRAGARPAELSGGEAQRVALARALAARPAVLLLDEPLSALDVRARGRIRQLMADSLARFDGIRVLVTHDPVEAMTLADRIVVLEGGRVTQTGSPAEIRRAPTTPYIGELVGVNLFEGRLEPLEEGAGRLVTPSGELVVGWPSGERRRRIDGVLATLRPADVSLHAGRPEGSARNVLSGPVASITLEGERARVLVRTAPPIVAEITLGSIDRLGLAREARVWLSFKAVEVTLSLP